MNLPRGIRNHNPLNLRERPKDRTVWVGERATDDDPQFEEFDYPEAGLRAGVRVLRNYKLLYGVTTIDALVDRYAPANGVDNNGKPYKQDARAYKRALANALGVDPSDPIDLEDFNTIFPLIKAMVRHENGPAPVGHEGRTDGTWYADAVLRRGIELGGIANKIPPATQSPTAKAAGLGGVLGTGLAVNEAVTLVDKAGGLAAMETSSLIRLVAIVVVVAVCWYIVARRARKSGQEG